MTYERKQAAGAKGWKETAYRTVFEVWAPGSERFTIHHQLCRECGFVLYTPRPTAEEVLASYRIHAKRPWSGPRIPFNPRRERVRSRRLYHLVAPTLASVVDACILDYGGGDGHLMERFVDKGATCHVVDYSSSAAPGVTSMGKTEDDLPGRPFYDVVICNHVIEHLLYPLQALRKLKAVLKERGVIYVEVPVEIWRKAPQQSEPVTHLNFFTPGSLKRLLLEAGFDVQVSRFATYPHPHGGWRIVASCIARNVPPIEPPSATSGVEEIERLLNPTLLVRVWRRLFLVRNISYAGARRLDRLLSRIIRPRS